MSIVRGCIDTDYMLRILNHLVNHYMCILFYTLLQQICIHYYWSSYHVRCHTIIYMVRELFYALLEEFDIYCLNNYLYASI